MKEELIAVYRRLCILADDYGCEPAVGFAIAKATRHLATALGYLELKESDERRNADADEAVRDN